MKRFNIIIIGAGPTGLGAAYRLKELGETDFHIFEGKGYAGGLAASFKDKQGFWWDIGGHVQFSHYEYFDKLMDTMLQGEWIKHERESWIWIFNRFVPYPFQNNIRRLPQQIMWECLVGLIDIYRKKSPRPANFREWILQTAGSGIAKYFLIPYNYKVWAYPAEQLNKTWVGERVAVTDLTRVIKNIVEKKDDVSWGPNNKFRFPRHGGTGEIWRRVAGLVGQEHMTLNTQVAVVNTRKKTIRFLTGEEIGYRYLISSMPLDKLVRLSDIPEKIKKTAYRLKHSAVFVVGVGLRGKPKRELASKCWMYFPEDNCPFYRVTLFSKYSPHNVPDSRHFWSLMTEVAGSPYKKVDQKRVVDEVIKGLINTKLIQKKDTIVSKWLHKEEYGYPTPSVERDEILSQVQPQLEKCQVYSRGRFGMWKYEISNQDHSFMQGVEVVDCIIKGKKEFTINHPERINGAKQRSPNPNHFK